jgi:2-keto-4-pentenoate hydratase/2-oxohepta-3-ene-1,7-dioic acid hydratase in catechol pathway
MKLASFNYLDRSGYGAIVGDRLVPVTASFAQDFPTLRSVLEGQALAGLAADIAGGPGLSLSEVQLLPPVPDAQRVFCIGYNYPKRTPEGAIAKPPSTPRVFTKVSGTLVGHGQALERPLGQPADSFDYEIELAAIIGRSGRNIAAGQALDYVAGYTVFNDGTVREWLKHGDHAGKNFANSGSCGPWMVSADEVDDLSELRLRTRLNDEIVQSASLSEMFFSLPEIIAYLSTTIDLWPGDMIATGSPAGAGVSRQPPRFLVAGDQLEFEISGIGKLANTVVQALA